MVWTGQLWISRQNPRFRLPVLVGCMLVAMTGFFSCATSRSSYHPAQKYSPAELQQDFTLFRNILQESHPSLYWFTSKDSMDYFFDQGYQKLRDSMTEEDFRTILSYIIAQIRCGHTAVKASKAFNRYLDTADRKIFPLSLKVWKDSAAVIGNLNRRDSLLRRGTAITSINGYSIPFLRDTFFNYIPGDGYSIAGRYQSLSNYGSFGSLYRDVFGLGDSLTIGYIDEYGFNSTTRVPVFDPKADTLNRRGDSTRPKRPKLSKKQIRDRNLLIARNVQIDTSLNSAYMSLNTFGRGNGLKHFFRYTFRMMNRLQIHHLVIDVRANGGGDASNSTLVTRYLVDHPFKLADSLYAVRRSSKYGAYIQQHTLYWLMSLFVTHKTADGHYHFGFFERHVFHPKKRHHYDGNIYIITGGNSFSAATLFAKSLKGQSNVTILGEETGGGAYGNTAWMIPDVTLPHTGVRFRLPKYRLVMDESELPAGRGVMPDIHVSPSLQDIQEGVDPKIREVRRLIEQRNGE